MRKVFYHIISMTIIDPSTRLSPQQVLVLAYCGHSEQFLCADARTTWDDHLLASLSAPGRSWAAAVDKDNRKGMETGLSSINNRH